MNIKTLTSLPIFRTRPGARDFAKEGDLQKWVAKVLRTDYPETIWTTNPFSGAKINEKPQFFREMKAQGWNASDPDYTILTPNAGIYNGLALELKVTKGKAWFKRSTQLKADSHIRAQGHRLCQMSKICRFASYFSEGTLETGLLIYWYMGGFEYGYPITERYQYEYQAGRYVPKIVQVTVHKIVGWQIGNDEFYY